MGKTSRQGNVMTIRSLIAAAFLAASGGAPAVAQDGCAAAAARVAARPNVRVVAVNETPRACRIRIIVSRPGQRPRSRVVVVRR